MEDQAVMAFCNASSSPAIQFVRYAISGGISTGVNVFVFYLLAFAFLPAVTAEDHAVKMLGSIFGRFGIALSLPDIPTGTRALNAAICNIAAFFASNAVCYLLNRAFVFRPGRHSAPIEAILFFAVSGISLLAGTLIQSFLIARFSAETTIGFLANLFVSLAVNFAARKYFVFKG